MIPKPIDQISKADIEDLVKNEIAEMKTIEYKQSLPGNSDEDKREFLADVSSFANASGGDIIYGVKEKRDDGNKPTGIPEKISGLGEINLDQEILRLERLLLDGLEPRIQGINFKGVSDFPEGPVLVLRIPKSWASPHMVKFKSLSRFYSRTSNGKYQLDVNEIRSAFALSESVGEKIKRFRDDRIGRIIAGETPILMKNPRKVVLHIFPVESVAPHVQIDVKQSFEEIRKYWPICSSGMSSWFNFDGVLTFDRVHDGLGSSYLQIFRNRVLEAVTTNILGGLVDDTGKHIPSGIFEPKLILSVEGYFKLLKDLNASPPFVIMLTLIGVKGLIMGVDRFSFSAQQPIDRDLLMLPDILVEDFNVDAKKVLRPVFDMVWQACGWERSMNYDEKGNWKVR